MLKDLVYTCRTYRRFYEEVRMTDAELASLVDLARMTACTQNCQSLKYKLVNDPETNAKVFACLGWAKALPDWDGPEEGERPAAYIVVTGDNTLGKNKSYDAGIAAQTIMLGAVELGYGGCMLMNVARTELAEVLGIDTERYPIHMVLALGKPKEKVVVVPMPEDGNYNYYRDEAQTHYVPKRALEDLLL